jgi:hypothetical protein
MDARFRGHDGWQNAYALGFGALLSLAASEVAVQGRLTRGAVVHRA